MEKTAATLTSIQTPKNPLDLLPPLISSSTPVSSHPIPPSPFPFLLPHSSSITPSPYWVLYVGCDCRGCGYVVLGGCWVAGVGLCLDGGNISEAGLGFYLGELWV
ncbi:unnamed protein product [Prunus armeniaca]